jgi:hypothetical protein
VEELDGPTEEVVTALEVMAQGAAEMAAVAAMGPEALAATKGVEVEAVAPDMEGVAGTKVAVEKAVKAKAAVDLVVVAMDLVAAAMAWE